MSYKKVLLLTTAIGVSTLFMGCGVSRTGYDTQFGKTNIDQDKNEWINLSVTGEQLAIDGLDWETQEASNALILLFQDNKKDLEDMAVLSPGFIQDMKALTAQINGRDLDRAHERARDKFSQELYRLNLYENHQIYMNQLSEATRNIQEKRTQIGRGINYRLGLDALVQDPVMNDIMFNLRRFDRYDTNSPDQRDNVRRIHRILESLDKTPQRGLTDEGRELLTNISVVLKISAAYGDINLTPLEDDWNKLPVYALEIFTHLVTGLKDDDRLRDQSYTNEAFDALDQPVVSLYLHAQNLSRVRLSLGQHANAQGKIVDNSHEVKAFLESAKEALSLSEQIIQGLEQGTIEPGYDTLRF